MGIKTELLAPAKNYECGIAAIQHGADAVYIAAQRFGAREAAGNSISDIERLVSFAHKYYVRVYLVLNTIIYENELEDALQIVKEAWNCGCDAVIIQDMGIMEMDIPPIPLFASTQTHNCDINKIKFLESVGFQRIILARELSLDQIVEIREQTLVDLEFFVHGALCVSYSGQCYMSQAIAKRSANRGTCAQFCRLPYNLLDENGKKLVSGKHLLSLRDLNLSAQLAQLMGAGITSFKIEGRLKDVSYVKNITSLYRQKLDSILETNEKYEKASSGTVIHHFIPDAKRSFSRGFTSYFLNGRDKGISSFDTPKSTGSYIGKVIRVGKDFFVIDSPVKINNGDGISFVDDTGNATGTRVNSVENSNVFPLTMKGITCGVNIFRNCDHAFEKQLTRESAIRQIKANIVIKLTKDQALISAIDEDGIIAEVTKHQIGQPARNPDIARQTLIEQTGKTGGTIFKFDSIEIQSNEMLFYLSAEINSWRRELIDNLMLKREEAYNQSSSVIKPGDTKFPSDSLTYTGNVSNSLARKFYCRHGVRSIDDSLETGKTTEETVLMFNKYCIKYELGLCQHKQNAKPLGQLYLQYNNYHFKILFDCKKCEMKIVL